jgi:hypothetical protein
MEKWSWDMTVMKVCSRKHVKLRRKSFALVLNLPLCKFATIA